MKSGAAPEEFSGKLFKAAGKIFQKIFSRLGAPGKFFGKNFPRLSGRP